MLTNLLLGPVGFVLSQIILPLYAIFFFIISAKSFILISLPEAKFSGELSLYFSAAKTKPLATSSA